MRVHWGTLAIGVGLGALGASYLWAKMIAEGVPMAEQNAYVLGQTNPTLPWASLTPAQKAQLGTNPAMTSPPGVTVGSATTPAPTLTTSGYSAGAFGNLLRRG